jgi:glycosyltransferase involved in cell wall biosynthesis
MKASELKVLYVCNDFPFPPMHGGLVDMWNRVLALNALGVTLDLIATVKEMPMDVALERVQDKVRNLHIMKRKSLQAGLLHWKPVQVVIRSQLRSLQINEDYDFVLMQSEFVTEILNNPTIKWRKIIIRVDNDEFAYQIITAKEEGNFVRKLYYLQEAVRIKMHSIVSFRSADMLWFVSHDDLTKFRKGPGLEARERSLFVPTAVDLGLMNRPSLEGKKALFVGSLWNPLNRSAVEWYLTNVHSLLDDYDGYRFVIAGSTRGKDCTWLKLMVSPFTNVELHLDAGDLGPIYSESALFVNPMQSGAGVKLKTVEAGVRGLPIISTRVGVEGTGLVQDDHFILATSAHEFVAGVKMLLNDKSFSTSMVQRCQEYLSENYDQVRVLRRALEAL